MQAAPQRVARLRSDAAPLSAFRDLPPPIPFPDLDTLARDHVARNAAIFREQMRVADAVTAATKNGHDAGHRVGYVEGKNSGMWMGGFVGYLLGTVATAAFFALRIWAATL